MSHGSDQPPAETKLLPNNNNVDATRVRVVDLRALWPELYARAKSAPWFSRLVGLYYSLAGVDDLGVPIGRHVGDDDDEVDLSCDSPTAPEWWILPHGCTIINGVFLYVVLRRLGYPVTIYESRTHVFLRDDLGAVYDLYWQPLGISDERAEEYARGRKVAPEEYWEKYDVYLALAAEGVLDTIRPTADNSANVTRHATERLPHSIPCIDAAAQDAEDTEAETGAAARAATGTGRLPRGGRSANSACRRGAAAGPLLPLPRGASVPPLSVPRLGRGSGLGPAAPCRSHRA